MTEGPVRSSGPYSCRRSPFVLAVTTHSCFHSKTVPIERPQTMLLKTILNRVAQQKSFVFFKASLVSR